MKYIPYHDHLLVKLIDQEVTIDQELNADQKPLFIQNEQKKDFFKLAEVVAVGDEINRKDYYLVFPGDHVLINEYAGGEIKSHDEAVYKFIKASDIVAITPRLKATSSSCSQE